MGKGTAAQSGEAPRATARVESWSVRLEQVLGRLPARRAVPLTLFVLSLAIGVFCFDDKLSLSGDNTEFIILARSLAQGDGMSLINFPTPRVATKYPFGFPLMLSPLAALFEPTSASGTTDWVAMKWLVVIFFAAAIVVLYYLVCDQWGRPAAVAVAALTMTNPLLVDYGHQVMSEVPFLLFSLLALLCLERGVRRREIAGNCWLLAGFAAMMWACYVRSMGIVLVAAAVLFAAQHRQYLKSLIIAAAAALVALPWMLRNRAVGSGAVYLKQLILVNPYYPDRGTLSVTDYVERLTYNLCTYVIRDIPSTLWPLAESDILIQDWKPQGFDLLSPLPLTVILLSIYAVALSVSRGYHLLALNYLILSTGILLAWPWAGNRFLVPFIPLMILFSLRVIADLAPRVTNLLRGAVAPLPVAAVAVTCLLAMNANGLDSLVRQARHTYPYNFGNYYAAGEWIRNNTSRAAVVCGRKPFWMYVVSGRKSVPYYFGEPSAVVAQLEEYGVDYVVVGQLSPTTFRHLVPAIQQYPERFELLWQLQGTATYVFGFRRPAPP